MYTNIPTGEAIQPAGERLKTDASLKERTPIKPEDVIRLLKLDIELAYFLFDGNFYAQPRGLGMGKSTSSPLSDIYMERFEQDALASFPLRDSVLFWLRKADDTLICINKTHTEYTREENPRKMDKTQEERKLGSLGTTDPPYSITGMRKIAERRSLDRAPGGAIRFLLVHNNKNY